MSRYSDEELEVVSLRDKHPWDDRRNENYVRQNSSPTRERSPRRRSPSYERREVRRGSRSPNNRRSNRSSERQLEEGERHSSSEYRRDDYQESGRQQRNQREPEDRHENDGRPRKRRRSSSSSSSETARLGDDRNKGLPMTLSWTRVEKVRNDRGERVYPSGIPRLTDEYKDQMEEIEKEKAERKKMENEGLFVEPNIKRQKTLSTYFNQMRQDFRDVKEWLDEPQGRPQKYYQDETGRQRRITIAVQKWPEPDFDDMKQENDKASGMCTTAEKRRWHHRSKYEAVYACDADKFDEDMEKRKRQTGRGRPSNSNMENIGRNREHGGNANMEAIGSRTRQGEGSRETLLPPHLTRRSPPREERHDRSIKVENEERRRDERDDRGTMRSDRDGYDRYSKTSPNTGNRREMSPRDYNRESYREPERRGYDQNRSQERPRSPPPMSRGPRTPPPQSNYSVKNERSPSPRSRYDDRSRRSPERDSYSSSLRNYQHMRENPSTKEVSSLQSSRRESYEYDDRRGRTGGNDSYVKRERV